MTLKYSESIFQAWSMEFTPGNATSTNWSFVTRAGQVE